MTCFSLLHIFWWTHYLLLLLLIGPRSFRKSTRPRLLTFILFLLHMNHFLVCSAIMGASYLMLLRLFRWNRLRTLLCCEDIHIILFVTQRDRDAQLDWVWTLRCRWFDDLRRWKVAVLFGFWLWADWFYFVRLIFLGRCLCFFLVLIFCSWLSLACLCYSFWRCSSARRLFWIVFSSFVGLISCFFKLWHLHPFLGRILDLFSYWYEKLTVRAGHLLLGSMASRGDNWLQRWLPWLCRLSFGLCWGLFGLHRNHSWVCGRDSWFLARTRFSRISGRRQSFASLFVDAYSCSRCSVPELRQVHIQHQVGRVSRVILVQEIWNPVTFLRRLSWIFWELSYRFLPLLDPAISFNFSFCAFALRSTAQALAIYFDVCQTLWIYGFDWAILIEDQFYLHLAWRLALQRCADALWFAALFAFHAADSTLSFAAFLLPASFLAANDDRIAPRICTG